MQTAIAYHSYELPNKYFITLVVVDNGGAKSKMIEKSFNVYS